jgi:hypothetical protein|tara:strand:+ start:2776 stop:3213 length:438 start_codon:yes stop_codon:yes gene_type:complete
MSELSQITLSQEITKLIEAGINKHIKSSFLYSPFRITLDLFKKSNPNTIRQVRSYVAQDIENILKNINNYDEEIFLYEGGFSNKGQEVRKLAYNIGIRLMKNKLNTRLAFKALRNNEIRQEIYNYILENVKYSVENAMISTPKID